MGRRPTTSHGAPRERPAAVAEFKFSDVEWARIAAGMGNAQNSDEYRPVIQKAARYLINARQNPELHPGYRSPPADRRAAAKIATAARKLSQELNRLPGYAIVDLAGAFAAARKGERPVDKTRKMDAFKLDLDRMAALAAYFSKNGYGFRAKAGSNVDLARNCAWGAAASWWERATGKRASAHELSEASQARLRSACLQTVCSCASCKNSP